MRRNLQDDFYKSMDQILEEVDAIKKKFNSVGPKFEGNQIILSDVCCLMITKAANHLTITSRQELNISSRKL